MVPCRRYEHSSKIIPLEIVLHNVHHDSIYSILSGKVCPCRGDYNKNCYDNSFKYFRTLTYLAVLFFKGPPILQNFGNDIQLLTHKMSNEVIIVQKGGKTAS